MTSSDSWPEPTAPTVPVYTPPGAAPVPPTPGPPPFAQPGGFPPPIPSHAPMPFDGEPSTSGQRLAAAGLAVVAAVLIVVDGVLWDSLSIDAPTTAINLVSSVALLVTAGLAMAPGPRERLGGLLIAIGLAVVCFDIGTRLAFLLSTIRAETAAVGLATVLCLLLAGLGAAWSRRGSTAGPVVSAALIGGALVAVGRLWLEWQVGLSVDPSLTFAVFYGLGGPLIALLGVATSRSAALLAAGAYGLALTVVEIWFWTSFSASASEILALVVILVGFGLLGLAGVLRRAVDL